MTKKAYWASVYRAVKVLVLYWGDRCVIDVCVCSSYRRQNADIRS